jgi:hypothetical protein
MDKSEVVASKDRNKVRTLRLPHVAVRSLIRLVEKGGLLSREESGHESQDERQGRQKCARLLRF